MLPWACLVWLLQVALQGLAWLAVEEVGLILVVVGVLRILKLTLVEVEEEDPEKVEVEVVDQ